MIEKTYAKVHGNYESIVGEFTGQGIEDLTGGVYTADILDPEVFWNEEFVNVNKNTSYACYRWDDGTNQDSKGLISAHAYSILRAVECEGIKLFRNPWGMTEWNGPWSDESKEWTPERMQLLNHRFGDDGSFWMTYEDFLKYWTVIDRCKLFDGSWQVYSTWIHYNVVPKSNGKYYKQPDDRFFSSSSNIFINSIFVFMSETYKARSILQLQADQRIYIESYAL